MPEISRPIRTAAVLAVGEELLGTDRVDTNSLWLSGRLAENGVRLAEKQVAGDLQQSIEARMLDLLSRHDLVVVTGGLGPTADDLTKEAAAAALGRRLVRDDAMVAALEERFRRRGYAMPEVNRKQADLVEPGIALANPRGTAPGFLLETDHARVLVLLPGPPVEMTAMFDAEVMPRLAPRFPGERLLRRTLRVASLPESLVEQKAKPVYERFGDVRFTILAAPGDVVLRWAVPESGDSSGERRLDEIESGFREALGEAIYGRDEESLAGVVVRRLAASFATLSVAESCTGGLLGARVTDVPGASKVFLGGVLVYSDEAKIREAAVPAEVLQTHGAVSEDVARALATGVRARFGSTHALAITGISGPDGGTAEKPVGTVHIALAGPSGVEAWKYAFVGHREMVRTQSAIAALDRLRRSLGPEGPRGGTALDGAPAGGADPAPAR